MQNKKLVFISLLVIGILFIAGVFYKNSQNKVIENVIDRDLLVKDYSIVKGDENASVEVVEFFDPACGTCAQFHFYLKDVVKKHKDDIKVVYRFAPFHLNSKYAVKMLLGANEQGVFVETLEYMFTNQRSWIDGHVVNTRKLWTLLSNVNGLDMKKLAASMENKEYDRIISSELESIEKLNVTKTPTYFVNGVELKNFGYENLVKLIESKIK